MATVPLDREYVLFLSCAKIPHTNNDSNHSLFLLFQKNKPFTMLRGGTHDLSLFDNLELKLRSDGGTYIANLQCDSFREDDLYQAFVYTKKTGNFDVYKAGNSAALFEFFSFFFSFLLLLRVLLLFGLVWFGLVRSSRSPRSSRPTKGMCSTTRSP